MMIILTVSTQRTNLPSQMLEYVLQDRFVQTIDFRNGKICQMFNASPKILNLIRQKLISLQEIYATPLMETLVIEENVKMKFAFQINNKEMLVIVIKTVDLANGVVVNLKHVNLLSLQGVLVSNLISLGTVQNVDSMDFALTQNAPCIFHTPMEWIPLFKLNLIWSQLHKDYVNQDLQMQQVDQHTFVYLDLLPLILLLLSKVYVQRHSQELMEQKEQFQSHTNVDTMLILNSTVHSLKEISFLLMFLVF